MVDPQDSLFWRMALRSGFVDATQLQGCWDAISPERRTVDAIDRRLARQVVEAGYLTSWQAQHVSRGRGDSLRIDRYVLLDMIGQGGMGRVFLARDTRLNRRVALKVLSQNRLNDAKAIDRFRREARLGAQLQHENLVRIYDEGEVDGHCYLVMEYIEGSSVGQLLAGHGPMPMSTASRLARQVALALEHARQKGMIHRDVNPHNLLVTLEGTAKLADLGLAIELNDANNLTLDGGLLGNYDYISPEQARNSRSVDSRSDIYSLGCTLYHMVTGHVPFPASSLPEKIQAQLTADPLPLSSHVPGLPREFEAVVTRMMRKTPAERHPNPMAVAKALEPFIGNEPLEMDEDRATPVYHRGAGNGHHAHASTQVFPVVPATIGGYDPPGTSPRSCSFSGSSPEMARTVPALPPTLPGGLTRTTTSHDSGPVLPTPPSPASPRPASRLSTLARRWPRLAEARGPGSRAAFFALLAATILSSSILLTRPWSRWTGPDARTPAVAEGSLTVVVVRADGKTTPASDLRQALLTDEPGALRIVLRRRGAGPVRLPAEGLEVRSGSVTIEADPWARPDLVVDLSGPNPFLRVGTRANLTLEGLSIRADHAGQAGIAPPLIEVKGALELRQCAFWTTDLAEASRAVTSEGLRLVASGCWFGGFKQCLDVAAFPGTEVELDQCMMIRSAGSDPLDSWAIRVRHESSHAAGDPRKLVVRRCTVRDACLLRLDDFHPGVALEVKVTETAVQAGALLAWKSEAAPARGCLEWTGRDNLYDLSKASRILRLDAPAAAPGGPNEPRVLAGLMDERGCFDRAIPFPEAPPTPPGFPRPEDFPIQVRDGIPVGAEPGQVGPASSPPAEGEDR